MIPGCVGGSVVLGVTKESDAFETSGTTDRTQRHQNCANCTALCDTSFSIEVRTEFGVILDNTKSWSTEFPDAQNTKSVEIHMNLVCPRILH